MNAYDFAIAFLVLLASVAGGAYLTNPFSRFSVIKQTFVVAFVEDAFKAIDENHKLVIRQGWMWRMFCYLKSLVHIVPNALF